MSPLFHCITLYISFYCRQVFKNVCIVSTVFSLIQLTWIQHIPWYFLISPLMSRVCSEIINIFLDAQSNGDLETSSHLIGFLSGDRHTFSFETQFPRFHFSSYVSNISFYSSLVTNFRSCVSALLLDFKISQDFVFSFPSFPFLFGVYSVLFSRPWTSLTTGLPMAPKTHFFRHSFF